MKPEEALAIVDNVVAQVQLSRADHVRLVEAVKTLSACIEQPPKPKLAAVKDGGKTEP